MGERKIKVLLVNPWIYDFAAFDFWQKPLGLLYIGALLRQHGFEISLLDCLDRFHPRLRESSPPLGFSGFSDGSGKYHREAIDKPACLRGVPRRYCRYGIPLHMVIQQLQATPPPDVILVTSCMTYWYPGVRDMVGLLRKIFPATPVLLGGVYATLCSDHAKEVVKPDYLIAGEGEEETLALLRALFAIPEAGGGRLQDEWPYPAYELYPELHSIALLTSRGCPFHCTFCASRSLSTGYRRRSPQAVYTELKFWYEQRAVRHVAFYDDALLHDGEHYARVLFRLLAETDWPLHFYTPNGLQPREIDTETADWMFRAGVTSIRLSYESSNPARQKEMSAKVNDEELYHALSALRQAGYQPRQIGVYVLMGLPDQEIAEVRESVLRVNRAGFKVNLASYSPIPGTREYQKAISMGLWKEDEDPLLANNSIYPVWRRKYPVQDIEALLAWVKQQNERLAI